MIIVLLVGGDRAANAFAEDQMASQFQSSLALSGKPHVTIQGFPFLTQLAARNFHQVDINASNETAGPGGQLEIASLTATLHGMHINRATAPRSTTSAPRRWSRSRRWPTRATSPGASRWPPTARTG